MLNRGKERISLGMSMQDAIFTLSEGNPGAVTVLMQMLQESEEGFFKMLSLDSYGIYGSRIWMLYKDVCGESLEKMMNVLDNVRTGNMSQQQLNQHIDQSIPII